MQQELNEWYNNSPGDWIANYCSSTYIWGCGKQGELGILSKKDWEKPIELNIDAIQQVVCGNALTLVITSNGTLMACGEGLEIIFNPYLREQSSRMIIVPILSDFKIAHVAVSRGPESHIVAITSFGDVYSWGIGSHGKLGHGHGTSLKKPKLIEGLRGKCAIQADCGHMHTAVVTSSGRLYTFGLGAIGQLGVEILTGSDSPRLVSFDDDDVKIGYVACGSNHTLALTQDGMSLYAFGDGAFGKLGLGDFNNCFSPVRVNLEKNILLKVCCGNNFSSALSDKGEVLTWGHSHYVGHSYHIENTPDVEDPHVTTPTINSHLLHDGVTIIDISAGNDTTFAISTAGLIYGWGSNDNNLLLSASKTHVYLPELIGLTKKFNFKQISCGRYHVCASAYSPHSYRYDIPGGPQFIHNPNDDMDKSRYPALKASNLNRFDLTARLAVISYWNELIRLTWQLWLPLTNQNFSISDNSDDQIDTDWPLISPISYLLPECNWLWSSFHYFRTSSLRGLLNIDNIACATNRYIAGSMITNRTYASLVKINRIEKDESVFAQTCHQVVRMHPMELRLPWRAWKVKLVHEGADDAGGAYDETISEICTELQSLDMGLNVLIPSPSDDTMFLPNPNQDVCQDYFRFLGILMGTAIRTKKPIDLNLDPLFWKLMTKSSVNVEDLRRLDPAYFNSLSSLLDTSEQVESYLKEVLFIENFVVFSANREENEMVYKGRDRYITQTSRLPFVHHAIAFRLHEFDICVAHIREGFSGVSPLLFLDLMTWSQLERAVCGSRTIKVSVLKAISRYVDADENNEIFSWFWDILEHFSETEKSLFLRFVTGKSRLPFENSKIPFRLFIYLSKQPVTSLPQAHTCFNQIRLPKYTSRAELESRLKIAISQCRSIDMDDYMLTRNRDI